MNKTYTLISGASSGIGKALAKIYAENNHNLLLVARRKNKLNELQSELESKFNIEAISKKCDLTNHFELEELLRFIDSNQIEITTLINNAGLGDFTLFENSSNIKNDQLIDLNIKAVVKLTESILPSMIENKQGNILNVASMAAYMPGPHIAVYAATKAFILNFTHGLASELKKYSINVSVLSPGDIETEFQQNAGLEGFEVKNSMTVDDLAGYTYEKFMIEKEREIIPPETRKIIEMFSKSGKTETISDRMFVLRKQLAAKLTK